MNADPVAPMVAVPVLASALESRDQKSCCADTKVGLAITIAAATKNLFNMATILWGKVKDMSDHSIEPNRWADGKFFRWLLCLLKH